VRVLDVKCAHLGQEEDESGKDKAPDSTGMQFLHKKVGPHA
jgi:hypothetical protein